MALFPEVVAACDYFDPYVEPKLAIASIGLGLSPPELEGYGLTRVPIVLNGTARG